VSNSGAAGAAGVAARVRRRSPQGPRIPWWLAVFLIFVGGRIASTIMLAILANQQAANAWTGAKPSLLDFSSLWDGRWYNIIAVSGYPSELPITAEGQVGESAWAFLPAYPAIVRGVMTIGSVPWNDAAVGVSLFFALAATLVFYKLLARVVPVQQALFAVVLFSVAPVSPLFQLAYAESMQLFLLALALYLLVRRKYGWMIPVILVLSFTRPAALALALVMSLHWIYRFAHRSRGRFPVRERMLVASVAVFAGISGLLWLVIAGVTTGVPDAYLSTELAWRSAYIGYQDLMPFMPWVLSSQWWLPGAWGYVALAGVVLVFITLMLTPAVKKLGVDIRFWLASYGLYLVAVFFPQSSTFRLLAPLFPALGALAAPRSRIYRVVLVIVSLALQWGWLLICWRVNGYDWTPP
jgi:hypothetical protein